jgi:hypothetical protein
MKKVQNSRSTVADLVSTPWGSYRPVAAIGKYTVTTTIGGSFYLYHARGCGNHGEALLQSLVAMPPDESGIAQVVIVGFCMYQDCECGGSVHGISLEIPVSGCLRLADSRKQLGRR